MNSFYLSVISVSLFGCFLCHDENTTIFQDFELQELEEKVCNITKRQNIIRLRIKTFQETFLKQKETLVSVDCNEIEEPEDPKARLRIQHIVERISKLEQNMKSIESFVKGEKETDNILRNLNGKFGQEFDDNILQIKTLSANMKENVEKSLKEVDNNLGAIEDFAHSRNVIIGGVLYYNGIGSPCSSSFDVCRVERSECRDGICQCTAGLSHNSLQEKCEETCEDGYRNTYQTVKNYIIRGYNNAMMNETTLKECKERCETEEGFVCRSFDYFPRWKSCYLSEVIKGNVEEAWEYNYAGVHFQRDCVISEH